ncbi:hypothetical protein PSE_2006 [Pseudovibrio sp. FO-BEG1]|uniref:Secreted protein n=1 Tax=Pseudovibrio brasiliensis TaxID=1898042 RepID=A0ABX8AWV1_9HYPH|nr:MULTISPECIES: hypothetical protein [Pseudovibrio]AEV36516.1 hypothetical protein PSE_2006 [Pseudovibrio sp. FO-BEG1]EEA94575.1 hypothetical protein PJE062_563 [Pseudovibrio sp. JE062]QUS58390.1 hypothetical protein KGB56_24010 [Pseudovibrio brasiliensis]
MQSKTTVSLIALSFLVISSGAGFTQINNFAEDPTANADANPLKSEYPDIISPVSDCPGIAEKYQSGGAGADPLGYPPNFGFGDMSAADQEACIKEINKDGNINEKQETEEENNILQN